MNVKCPSVARRAVLLGAGHAHLYSLNRAAEFARSGFELVVVAPENFWYSGSATGVLGGRYAPEQDQVDVGQLVTAGGERCRLIASRAAAIDPMRRTVQLENGESLRYDVLSINVGSEVRAIAGISERVYPIKPLRNLVRLRDDLREARAAGEAPRVVIAGGGPSGCEIAGNIRDLLGQIGEITILADGDGLVPMFSERARKALMRQLTALRIRVSLDSAVQLIACRMAHTTQDDRIPFDFLVNATGLHPPAFLKRCGLPATERGELIVDEFLRSIGCPRVFGGGDCVAMQGRTLAKIGIYAVREAPILFRNLMATLSGKPLRAFCPQRRFLLILNLGQGVGLGYWRGWHWLGRSAFWLKDRIDRAFLARYQ
jgi:NADH dehydrogenase FAD-containing subunit